MLVDFSPLPASSEITDTDNMNFKCLADSSGLLLTSLYDLNQPIAINLGADLKLLTFTSPACPAFSLSGSRLLRLPSILLGQLFRPAIGQSALY